MALGPLKQNKDQHEVTEIFSPNEALLSLLVYAHSQRATESPKLSLGSSTPPTPHIGSHLIPEVYKEGEMPVL